MRHLVNAFRYNAWATKSLFDAAEKLDEAKRNQPVEGIFGSVLMTARHMLQVEHGYLGLMFGEGEPRDFEDAPLAWLREWAPQISEGYLRHIEGLTDEGLARQFNVPWFERDFSVEDGLLQVLTHSTEHRADLASAISRLGVKTPPIDYVIFVYTDGGPVPEEWVT